MFNVNGPGFQGLYSGDSVEFRTGAMGTAREDVRLVATRTARILPLLVFADHVQVAYGPCGYTVDASNFVRLVRRGRRHIQADGTDPDSWYGGKVDETIVREIVRLKREHKRKRGAL